MKNFFLSLIKNFRLNPDDRGVWRLFGKPVLIGFYEHEFYPLSNFSSFQIEIDGILYPTSEHAYHVFKFSDPKIQEEIRTARSAHDAFAIAQGYREQKRADWNEVRTGIMKRLLLAKIDQHPYAMKKLMDSGTIELVENSWRDEVWGWGEERNGKNLLGKMWMEIRKELIAKNNV